MSNIKQKYLISAIVTEIVLLVCSIVLTGISLYIWGAVALFGVLLVITVYRLVKVNSETQEEKQQLQEKLANRNFQWMESFKSELTETLQLQNQQNDEKLLKLAELQEQLSERNYEWMESFGSSMIEMQKKQHQEIGDSIQKLINLQEQLSDRNSEWQEEFNTSMTDILNNQHEKTANKIRKLVELQEHFSDQNFKWLEVFQRNMNETLQKQRQETGENLSNLAELQKKIAEDNKNLSYDIANSVKLLNSQQENSGNLIHAEIQHLNEMQSNMLKNYELQSNAMQQRITEMGKLQLSEFEKLEIHTSGEIKQFSTNLETFSSENVQHMSDQMDMLSELLKEMQQNLCDTHSSSIQEIGHVLDNRFSVLQQGYDRIISDANQQYRAQLVEVKNESNAILNRTEEALLLIQKAANKQTSDMLHSVDEALQMNLKDAHISLTSLIDQIGEKTDKRLDQIESANSKMTNIVNDVLDKKITEMTTSVTQLTNENVNKLMSAYDSTVQNSAAMLTKQNESFHFKQDEMLTAYLEQLSKMYDSLLEQHTNYLNEQIQNSISQFTEENKHAVYEHNERTLSLLEQETKFVNELEANNIQLRNTITEALGDFSMATSESIAELEKCVEKKLADETHQNSEYLEGFASKQEHSFKQLDEKLHSYSDSLVKKSAEAVAALQSDNNRILQELGERVKGFAEESSRFAKECTSINVNTNDNIKQLIESHSELVTDLEIITEKGIGSMDKVLDKRITDMTGLLEILNKENSNSFRASMEDYREKFLSANVKALAGVQKDNLDAITNANNKIAELAEKLKYVNEQLPTIIMILKDSIDTGVNTFKDNNQHFYDTVSDTVDEKLDDYNSTFSELKDLIEQVMLQCQSNTDSYQETLKHFTQHQRDANDLTKKDIEILQKLVKR
ncbi:hypothetical protein [Ruminococcus flavefaciens]|uniref:hypothetical protein n=1 Tax=Ruminococcus flavefaciens TaxID=1265 RepID=UPI0026E91FDA|nr:hypothetical protein [Ruminococcus flavefaciens]